jgi:inosine-uridine nucleoside N-ribohydrolase
VKTNYKQHIIFVLSALTILCISSCSNNKNKYPLLIISDFGTDVDDAQAIAYLCASSNKKNANIAGIITTGDIPGIRAQSLEYFLSSMGKNIPIIIGSAFNMQRYPISEKDSAIIANDYLKGHLLNGIPYELSLLDYLKENCKNHTKMIKAISAEDFIDKQINRYKGELKIVILAQATDFAKYVAMHQQNAKFIKTIVMQGQVRTTPTGMEPDFEAYNLRKDTLAAKVVIGLQKQVPMIFVGKYAAYSARFSKNEAASMGGYITKATFMGIESFAQRDPISFQKLFKCNNIESLTSGNSPYDLITAMCITDKNLFTPIIYYNGAKEHKLIGNDSLNICIRDIAKLKRKFLTVYAASSHQ